MWTRLGVELLPAAVVVAYQTARIVVQHTQPGQRLAAARPRGRVEDQPRVRGAQGDHVLGAGLGVPGGRVEVLRTTLTGVSSPHSTGSARNAVVIAASKPAGSRRSDSRSCARATNPGETGAPRSVAITIAVRSTGTLPSLDNNTAAAFTFGP
jgi:hypothetical protein